MVMGRKILAGILFLVFCLSVTTVFAAKEAETQPIPVEQDAHVADSISKVFGFSVDTNTVTGLREKNYSYGEIAYVYSLAVLSKKTSTDVIKLRDSRLSWAEVADKVKASPDKGQQWVNKIMKEAKMEKEAENLKTILAKEVKPGKISK